MAVTIARKASTPDVEINRAEARAWLNISQDAFDDLVAAGRLKPLAYRPGFPTRFSARAVSTLADARRRATTSQKRAEG